MYKFTLRKGGRQMIKRRNMLKYFVLLLAACSLCTFAAGCFRAGEVLSPEKGESGPDEDTAPEKTPGAVPPQTEENPAIPAETDIPIPSEKETCLAPGESAQKWIRLYEETYGAGLSEKILMEESAIRRFNESLIGSAEYMVDVSAFDDAKAVTAEMLRAWIEAGTLPAPCYKANGTEYSPAEIGEIYRNRNIDGLGSFSVLRGVVTDRADLRTVPYGETVLKAAGDIYYDRIQETELIAGMPVWILHESLDREYYYVQAYYYRGWVLKTKIAAVSEDADWKLITEPERFAVVTDAMLTLGGRSLDMGTRFALEKTTETGYRVILPGREENGMFVREYAVIPFVSAHLGYIPFTMQNYYIQAFKYEGRMYGFGGTDGGVDCSSYACAVFRSFGLMLPRNSGQQGTIIGNARSLSGLNSGEKKDVLSSVSAPAIIYRPGHIMLWLGVENGECRMIQAPQGGETVKEGLLSLSDERLTLVIVIGS